MLFKTCERGLLYCIWYCCVCVAISWCSVVCTSVFMHVNVSDLILVCVNLPGINSVILETCKLMCLRLCLSLWLQWFGYHVNPTVPWTFSVSHTLPSTMDRMVSTVLVHHIAYFLATQVSTTSIYVCFCFCVTVQRRPKHTHSEKTRNETSCKSTDKNSVLSKSKGFAVKLHCHNKWAVLLCNTGVI